MLTAPANFIFDLDGTLVDTVPDLAFAVDEMARAVGLPPPGPDRVRVWVGNGLTQLIKRALTGRMDGEAAPEQVARAAALFKAAYADHYCVDSRLYPGARETLAALRAAGKRLAVVTNKNAAFTEPILRHYGLAPYLDTVLSGDSLKRQKPDPEPLFEAVRRLGGGTAWLVGDSANDVQAARAAGLPVVCVSYGYNHGHDIREAQPDAIIDSLTELLPLIGKCE